MTISVTIFIVIQERLRHSVFSTTMNLYAHVSPGMQKQAVDKFDEMMVTHSRENDISQVDTTISVK